MGYNNFSSRIRYNISLATFWDLIIVRWFLILQHLVQQPRITKVVKYLLLCPNAHGFRLSNTHQSTKLHNLCLEVLTVYCNELLLFGLRHSPYYSYQFRAPDLLAPGTTFHFFTYDVKFRFEPITSSTTVAGHG